ncbi:MAG: DUF1543 domain-containing protein [Chitinophagaceae bacterium]
MPSPKLYMLLLGACLPMRHTEQHDIFFCIGENLISLIPAIKKFWPEAKENIHIDAWRQVTQVNGYNVKVTARNNEDDDLVDQRLFFINLGGYKKDEFDEFHYKMIVVATEKGEAVRQSKQTAFFKHMGFKGATSHIDDKYGVDVDDLFEITDILPADQKELYAIELTSAAEEITDEIHLGYFRLDKLEGL